MERILDNPRATFADPLRSGAESLGVRLTDEQVWQFARYAALLEEWNRVVNLTRVPSDQTVPLHFLDSLTVARAVDLTRPLHFVDVGTGAGLPGMALKIAFPHLEVMLLDSTRKRLDFLDTVIAELGLRGVATLHARAEDAGRDPAHRESYDVAAARAVTRMNALAELMLPLVRVGGQAVAMKSAGVDEEIEESLTAVGQLGGSVPHVTTLKIPGTDIDRKLVVLDKLRPTSGRFPRDSASIKSRPLL